MKFVSKDEGEKLGFSQHSVDSWMYPDPNVPLWEIPIYNPYIVGIYALYSPT